MSGDTPYVGWLNETLEKLAPVSDGDTFVCPVCGVTHTLKGNEGEPKTLMFYYCQDELRLGAVKGHLVVGVKPDVSSGQKHQAHTICDDCWKKRGEDRLPARLKSPPTERCCYCGKDTSSGIYLIDPSHQCEAQR